MFKVEIEVCPTHLRWGGGAMKVLGFVTEPAVMHLILAHLERRHVDARPGRRWASEALRQFRAGEIAVEGGRGGAYNRRCRGIYADGVLLKNLNVDGHGLDGLRCAEQRSRWS